MARWEYKILFFPDKDDSLKKYLDAANIPYNCDGPYFLDHEAKNRHIEELLNRLGNQGWELTAVDHHWFFKRELH